MGIRRFGHLIISALSGVLFAFALFCLLAGERAQAHAEANTVRYVASGGDCGGAMPCYATVQAAVDAACAGDEIRAAAGTYTDLSVRPRADGALTDVVTQVVYISQTITLRGGYLVIKRRALDRWGSRWRSSAR